MKRDDYALELLAPAKNAAQGIEAIRHGADAVYIGAPAFGARAAVPVSLEDISEVVRFAHLFGAKVYVALNTILYPKEVSEAVQMAWDLYRIGADALIIQDLALLGEEMPPIALHSSTQMDNVSPEKLSFWQRMGFEQAVVARELSPRQIAKLHQDVPELRLEAFVHGALCVSYSGRCYAAAAFHGRSANRGSCSQVCRLPFDLIDGQGHVLARNKHLLSLKDLNRSEVLSELIDAGVRSFKIEGRLKDLSYVKTVTAFYHRKLDDFIKAHPEFHRASHGTVELGFSPDVSKAFSRGFTTFTHRGRGADDLAAFDTPKSKGEEIGTVLKVEGSKVKIRLNKGVTLNNGDGFTFFEADTGDLSGFRINTVVGSTLTVIRPVKGLKSGLTLFRNCDRRFEGEMEKETAVRRVPLDLRLSYEADTLILEGKTGEVSASSSVGINLEPARNGNPSASTKEVLSKLGGTIFSPESLILDGETAKLFIPRSMLSRLRQDLVPALEEAILTDALNHRSTRDPKDPAYKDVPFFKAEAVQSDNLLNPEAKAFVEKHEAKVLEEAYEKAPSDRQPLMTTKHCIRYALGMCPPLLHFDENKLHEPWILRSEGEGTSPLSMRLEFDCPNCQMLLFKA